MDWSRAGRGEERRGEEGVKLGAMKFGRLLLQLLEQMPVEYRDKFLSYKQLKKVINTILKDNSLPVAAFVEVPEEDGERASVETITARDEEVAWPRAEGVERAAKRARGEERTAVAVAVAEEGKGGEGDGVAVEAGMKRKVGGGAGGNVAAVAVQEKELSKEEEDFLHLLNVDLEKFNHFFTEKEEDYVIRLQVCRIMSYIPRYCRSRIISD